MRYLGRISFKRLLGESDNQPNIGKAARGKRIYICVFKGLF